MDVPVNRFRLDGNPVSCEKHGHGHINKTYLITCDTGSRYIIQRISRYVFPKPGEVMENVRAVCEFLSKKVDDPRQAMQLAYTHDGGYYYVDGDGEFWRVFSFIDGGLCLDHAETVADFYESAVAFGRFQAMLTDFPAGTLHESIPRFHDTPDRYKQLHRAIDKNAAGRRESAREEIDFALSLEKDAGELMELYCRGELPLRVTHNDTKLNNVILDAGTRKAVCVIDLDTVMPGLAACDFGDAIRFGASTAVEDEQDLSKVQLDLELYKAFAEGYLSAAKGLTEKELESLPLGAKIITLECGTRFLADYLNGDVYFSTDYPEHNLVRARTQFKLVRDMLDKWDEIIRITEAAAAKA